MKTMGALQITANVGDKFNSARVVSGGPQIHYNSCCILKTFQITLHQRSTTLRISVCRNEISITQVMVDPHKYLAMSFCEDCNGQATSMR